MSTHGPHQPSSGTPPRRPGSVRRTSSIDMTWPDGLRSQRLVLSGRARDLRTDGDGTPHVDDDVTLVAEVDRSQGSRLVSIEARPSAAVDTLVGERVASGFRAVVSRELPEHEHARSALFLLLDDLPVTALISGYAYQLDPEFGPSIRVPAPPRDLCAGWAGDGTMMAAIDAGVPLPLATGPVAPSLTTDDGDAWHDLPSLPPVSMRRRRRLDVHVNNGDWHVDAMFRDSWVPPDGVETVVHEYSVSAQVDAITGTFTGIDATPRVLPWPECPAAAASPRRLVGTTVDDLRERVRAEFTGTSTCTHLNDLLRSLADVPALAQTLDQGGPPPSM